MLLTPKEQTNRDPGRTVGPKNAVLKVYNVIFKDGKWILQPQWKLAAKEINLADSLQLSGQQRPRLKTQNSRIPYLNSNAGISGRNGFQ